jgi:hypothetical protein
MSHRRGKSKGDSQKEERIPLSQKMQLLKRISIDLGRETHEGEADSPDGQRQSILAIQHGKFPVIFRDGPGSTMIAFIQIPLSPEVKERFSKYEKSTRDKIMFGLKTSMQSLPNIGYSILPLEHRDLMDVTAFSFERHIVVQENTASAANLVLSTCQDLVIMGFKVLTIIGASVDPGSFDSTSSGYKTPSNPPDSMYN